MDGRNGINVKLKHYSGICFSCGVKKGNNNNNKTNNTGIYVS